jgi:hypothetical protein
MLELNNITLLTVSTVDVEESIQALAYSNRGVKFKSVKLFSHYNPSPHLDFYDFIKIRKFKNVEEWGYFIVYELHNYIETDYILLIHADGFVVNPNSWTNDFLKYDYIGAPWPIPNDDFTYKDQKNRLIRVGNSVSLRSLRLLKFPSENKLKWTDTHGFFHEDGYICTKINHLIEDAGMRFAPIELAVRFSQETPVSEAEDIKPFVFHKWMGSNNKNPRFGSYNKYNYKYYLKKIKKLYAKII